MVAQLPVRILAALKKNLKVNNPGITVKSRHGGTIPWEPGRRNTGAP